MAVRHSPVPAHPRLFIGSQPFGVWAGAVQFKHRSVRSALEGIGPTVFEGYVGTTPSGFPSEVDLAKQAAADLYVENLAAAHAGGAASGGPGVARINAQLEELRRDAGGSGETVASPRPVDGKRRTAMLRSVSRNVFVGPLTDCFFDPDVALCLRDHDRSAATAPIVGRCQPDRCRNSRIGDHHLVEWEDRLAQLRRDLRTRGLPPIQRQHLATSGTAWPQPSPRSEPTGRTAHERQRRERPPPPSGDAEAARPSGSFPWGRPNGEPGRLREELAGTVTKLQQKNAEITRLRAELNTLACRVALLSEENEQLRSAAGTGPVVGLPSGGKAGP